MFSFWLFFWLINLTIWFNLIDEISWFMKKNNWDSSKIYQETFYSSNLSKDPYWEAIKNIKHQSVQQKISWTEYIEKVLSENGCSTLSQKKIWAILYYYVPEFKSDLAMNLKKDLGEFNSKNFIVDHNKVKDYCYEYFNCITWAKTIWEIRNISHYTPNDTETSCKEFFQENYKKWQRNKQREQNVQTAQLWFDKYRNSTTDDSPYDIMVDFWNVWKLLYQEVENPITPVSYRLPIFSNSVNSLKEHEKDNSTPINPIKGGTEQNYPSYGGSNPYSPTEEGIDPNEPTEGSSDPNDPNGQSSDPNPTSNPNLSNIEWLNDYLLWLFNLQNNTTYYGNKCEGNNPEPEENYFNQFFYQNSPTENLNLTDEEYEDLVEYMQKSVDDYLALTEEQKEEISKHTWNPNSYINNTSPSDLEDIANQIKNCFQSCDGLRFDQKASCMMMCACWEINSPIFDPNKTPWLWPILMIRFCTVPWINHNFSIWWRKIMSIEEWISEIYWVVDKLSREWKLWIRTQQYNFLDSTTKKTKISNTVAFTINVELANIRDYKPKQSTQYKTKKATDRNETLQATYHISNDLENPVQKNRYILINDNWNIGNDFSSITNTAANKSKKSQLSVSSYTPINQNANADASRYNDTIESLHRRVDQQWHLWSEISNYINELDKEAKMLYAKKRI